MTNTTSTPASHSTSSDSKTSKFSRKRMTFLISFIILAVLIAAIWWRNNNLYIISDDANIDSYRIDISSLVSGQLAAIYVQEGDSVQQGMPLFEVRHPNTMTEDGEMHFSNYKVTAPVAGVIGKRWSLPGDIINAGETIFTLNEDRPLWVAVYLEESKFQHIQLNQEASFTLDAYPKLKFSGQIFYIGHNTASEFTLIPPNNASGNYTKIAQRIPIKISIDRIDGKETQKMNIRLVSGMSATVKIRKTK